MEEYVKVGEFARAIASLESAMQNGFTAQQAENAQLRTLVQGATVEHGERLATLEERTRDSKRTAVNWGLASGGGAAGVLTILWGLLKSYLESPHK